MVDWLLYTAMYRYIRNIRSVAVIRLFSPDSSGILTQTMAMRTVAGGGVEVTATPADTLVRTPSARQIQADSGIGYYLFLFTFVNQGTGDS